MLHAVDDAAQAFLGSTPGVTPYDVHQNTHESIMPDKGGPYRARCQQPRVSMLSAQSPDRGVPPAAEELDHSARVWATAATSAGRVGVVRERLWRVTTAETDEQRERREQLRCLFDRIAGLYDASRQGYPAEIIDAVCGSSGIGPGADVLEIGCGTGQLTRQLAGRAFHLTAIDISAAMVETARRNVADPTAQFEVCSFEDFAGGGQFDLIASATAFHWVDPSIGWAKAARLLRPGGWLALISTEERYPEPLRTRLRELWTRYSRQIVRSAGQPAWVRQLRDTTLFGEPVELLHTRALRLSVQAILAVERTRATFLSYSEQDQAGFAADLSALLEPRSHVDLVQETLLAMAPTPA